ESRAILPIGDGNFTKDKTNESAVKIPIHEILLDIYFPLIKKAR
ncbi:MAG: hypothetical protein PWQ85_1605, partial [Geotoga sp.]|nr:hypothetical protein [Geotoga sp.]